MSSLHPHAEPEELGLDSHRLSRINDFFDDFVDKRKLAGWLATVSRGGQLAYVGKGGHADRELDRPVQDDTIWRIYSMTKPITAIAAMMLHEEGKFDLNDPAGKWIEALRESRIYTGGSPSKPTTVAATEPVRIWHLMSHMAGLTYGFTYGHNVDAIYRLKGHDFGWPKDCTLEQAVNDWCTSPLIFNPGSA
jgi:CubicO group peptidase (beta-lactamase class C family)